MAEGLVITACMATLEPCVQCDFTVKLFQATSRLLVSYRQPQRDQILDLLFKVASASAVK